MNVVETSQDGKVFVMAGFHTDLVFFSNVDYTVILKYQMLKDCKKSKYCILRADIFPSPGQCWRLSKLRVCVHGCIDFMPLWFSLPQYFLVVELSPGTVHMQCWQGQRVLYECRNLFERPIFIFFSMQQLRLSAAIVQRSSVNGKFWQVEYSVNQVVILDHKKLQGECQPRETAFLGMPYCYFLYLIVQCSYLAFLIHHISYSQLSQFCGSCSLRSTSAFFWSGFALWVIDVLSNQYLHCCFWALLSSQFLCCYRYHLIILCELGIYNFVFFSNHSRLPVASQLPGGALCLFCSEHLS